MKEENIEDPFLRISHSTLLQIRSAQPKQKQATPTPRQTTALKTFRLVNLPEKLVEISMLHVLKDHNERVPVHTNPVEFDYVVVLQVGQQLGFALEVLPRCESGVLQRLRSERVTELVPGNDHRYKAADGMLSGSTGSCISPINR